VSSRPTTPSTSFHLPSFSTRTTATRARAACRRLSLRSSDARRSVARFRLSFLRTRVHILAHFTACCRRRDLLALLSCRECCERSSAPNQTTTPKALLCIHYYIVNPITNTPVLKFSQPTLLASSTSPAQLSSRDIAISLFLFRFSVYPPFPPSPTFSRPHRWHRLAPPSPIPSDVVEDLVPNGSHTRSQSWPSEFQPQRGLSSMPQFTIREHKPIDHFFLALF